MNLDDFIERYKSSVGSICTGYLGDIVVTYFDDKESMWFNSVGEIKDKEVVKEICIIGQLEINDRFMFRQFTKLVWITGNTPEITTDNLAGMFYCKHYFMGGNLPKWDVSGVKYMSWMFQCAISFDQDIGNWDVSNVRNMSYMFNSALIFNQDISRWNVKKLTQAFQMFEGAIAFNPDYISEWNVSPQIVSTLF